MESAPSHLLFNFALEHGCANHDTEGKRLKFPHPLLWCNEASILDQWRTMYFPLTLFAYTMCCRRTEQCFSVLRTHKSDVVDGSSGRHYVTDQWHNVSLLRARALEYAIRRIKENRIGLELNEKHQLCAYTYEANIVVDNYKPLGKIQKSLWKQTRTSAYK